MKRHDDQSVRKGCGDGVKLRDNSEGEERGGRKRRQEQRKTRSEESELTDVFITHHLILLILEVTLSSEENFNRD